MVGSRLLLFVLTIFVGVQPIVCIPRWPGGSKWHTMPSPALFVCNATRYQRTGHSSVTTSNTGRSTANRSTANASHSSPAAANSTAAEADKNSAGVAKMKRITDAIIPQIPNGFPEADITVWITVWSLECPQNVQHIPPERLPPITEDFVPECSFELPDDAHVEKHI
eukprot:6189087-Pleurochrysis_carterae.AAC.2